MIDISLTASATSATVGNPVAATATIRKGRSRAGRSPSPPSRRRTRTAPARRSFTSAVSVVGNATYRSGAFVPARTGAFRWVVSYSGDANHAATKTALRHADLDHRPATPSIASSGPAGTQRRHALPDHGDPAGRLRADRHDHVPDLRSQRDGLRQAAGSTNTVTVSANGTVSSAPFVALNPGRYRFVASYSGNSNNQAATESCDPNGRVAVVSKRVPKVKPNARLKGKRISIRARLIGATSPIGMVRFRLYRPGNKTCAGKPAFSGGVTVKANGRYLLAQYLARKPGIYRIAVSYSGDKRNKHYDSGCTGPSRSTSAKHKRGAAG